MAATDRIRIAGYSSAQRHDPHQCDPGRYCHFRTSSAGCTRDRQALDFVVALPKGPLTLVGEGGSALSAGQRQRIALARALVVAPSLLILDEATAALDARTEKAVMTALQSVPGLTLLVVSHQPSLAAIADNVYDLANQAPQRGREHVVSRRRSNDLTASSPG